MVRTHVTLLNLASMNMTYSRMALPLTRLLGAVSLLAAAVLLPAGCASSPKQGYSFQTAFPTDVSTVAVPIFRNLSTNVGIEAELTEAVIKELQRSSELRIVSDQSTADSTLAAVITQAGLRKLNVRSGTGLVQELAYQITVDFEWRDERRGKALTSQRNFTGTDTFVPATGVGERLETGQHATIQRLARDMVAQMRSGW